MAKKPKKRRRNRNDPRRKEIQQQREEARRRVAEQRRAEAEAEQQRRKRLSQLRRFGLPALAGISVMVIALVLFRPARELPAVQQPPPIEATQLAAGETFDYVAAGLAAGQVQETAVTPTSGPFLPSDPECGVYTEEISDEQAVTALYHGGIVLWHDPTMSATDIAALGEIASEFDEVTVSPSADITDEIVATSWGRLRSYDGPGDDVREYVTVYLDRGVGEGTCSG